MLKSNFSLNFYGLFLLRSIYEKHKNIFKDSSVLISEKDHKFVINNAQKYIYLLFYVAYK